MIPKEFYLIEIKRIDKKWAKDKFKKLIKI